MLRQRTRTLKFLLAAAVAAAMASAALADEPAVEQDAPLRIVSFGTSLSARGRWQKPLEDALSACLRRPVEVRTVALSGSTSDWGLAHAGDVVALRPDVVLVEFYANDAAVNRWTSVGASRANIEAIFGALRSGLPGARLFGMGMNPMHGWRGWARPFLARYTKAHRIAAEKGGNGYIDFGPRWAGLSDAEIAEAIPDGTHPRPETASRVMVPELLGRIAPGRCGEGSKPPEGDEITR